MPIYLPFLVLEITDTVHAMPTKPSPLPVFGIVVTGLHLDFAHISLFLEWQLMARICNDHENG